MVQNLNQTDRAFKQMKGVSFNMDLVDADQVFSNNGGKQ